VVADLHNSPSNYEFFSICKLQAVTGRKTNHFEPDWNRINNTISNNAYQWHQSIRKVQVGDSSSVGKATQGYVNPVEVQIKMNQIEEMTIARRNVKSQQQF